MELATDFLKSMFEQEGRTSLSRRDALAGLGLVGLLLAAPKLIGSTVAEAKPLDQAAEAARPSLEPETNASDNQVGEADAADPADVTDLSARRYWRRHYWHRRYWRRRYWRRRIWVRRRYWRRRYWRRRYW